MCSHITPAQRARFVSKVRPAPTGCLEWQGSRKRLDGVKTYGQFWCGVLGVDGRMRLAHRVAWGLQHGAIPDGLKVLHRCDNVICVNVAHLFLGTSQDNYDDMAAKGRRVISRGSQHGSAVLTEAQVLEVRRRRRAGESRSSVAAAFEVSERTIGRITNNQGWTHV